MPCQGRVSGTGKKTYLVLTDNLPDGEEQFDRKVVVIQSNTIRVTAMSNTLSIKTDTAYIRPLSRAENEFLQVLLPEFSIRRKDQGLVLDVKFDFETPAVWSRQGKNHIQQQLDRASVQRYQHEIEDVLLGHEAKDWTHNDPAFPFRFGNGGTLPVIHCENRDYYCLFYREIEPVGWNIANGGAESSAELLDPLATIERELREELFIVDPVAGHRYVFDWTEGRRADHPDFVLASRVWKEVFGKQDLLKLKDLSLPLKWLSGNDSVVIKFDDHPLIEITDCILNINAEDFGIEIDRVAKMAVGPNAILCDGEIIRGRLLNRVIGLFEVHRFNAAMASGRCEYQPDRVFYNGRDRSADGAETVVDEYLADVFERGVWAKDVRPNYEATERKFGLCPVTRNLIRRFPLLEHEQTQLTGNAESMMPPTTSPGKVDVFLSFASEDLPLAQQVFSFLKDDNRNVFFSEETAHQANFGDAIDVALCEADSLVVVGTQTDHFFKPWVRYEWQSFHNDIMGRRKPWDTPLITLAANCEQDRMPRPLLFREILPYSPESPTESFHKLRALLDTP